MPKREYQVRVERGDNDGDEVYCFTCRQKAVAKYRSIRGVCSQRRTDMLEYHGTRAMTTHIELVEVLEQEAI